MSSHEFQVDSSEPAKAHSATVDARVVRPLWWLHPAWAFALAVGITIVAAYYQSNNSYLLYGTPKYVTFNHVLMAFAAIGTFAVGTGVANASRKTPQSTSEDSLGIVTIAFYVTLALTLLGYLVWFAVGFKNGFSMGLFFHLLSGNEPIAYDSIRKELFGTIPGVTTCSQFAVAAALFGTWLYIHGKKNVAVFLVGLVLIAAFRTILFSERMALAELLFPVLMVVLRNYFLGKPWPGLVRWVLKAAPVLAIAALLIFFGGFEFFRSWKHYQNKFDSFAEFTVWRLSGYYTTAHNNGAMALATNQPRPLPYYTLKSVWEFPGMASAPIGYQKMTGLDIPSLHEQMLDRYGTLELNNEGGLFQPAIDYGWGGFLLYWFVYGFLAMKVYRRYLAGTLGGVTIYPLVYLSVLEVPLAILLMYTRFFPPMFALLLCAWVVARSTPRSANAGFPLSPGALVAESLPA